MGNGKYTFWRKDIFFTKVIEVGLDKENYMWKKIKDFIVVAIGVISGILTIISFIWLVLDVKIEKLNLVIDLNFFFGNIDIVLLNITVRRSRQSGVARATCPD